MLSFIEVYEDTVEKLGRQLLDNELQFLQWVYRRYQEEQELFATKCRKI